MLPSQSSSGSWAASGVKSPESRIDSAASTIALSATQVRLPPTLTRRAPPRVISASESRGTASTQARSGDRSRPSRPPRMKPPQVVVVTGASAGVGRAVVRAFARRGASVGLLARGAAGLQAAATEVRHAGGRAVAVPTDVVLLMRGRSKPPLPKWRMNLAQSISGSTMRWFRCSLLSKRWRRRNSDA